MPKTSPRPQPNMPKHMALAAFSRAQPSAPVASRAWPSTVMPLPSASASDPVEPPSESRFTAQDTSDRDTQSLGCMTAKNRAKANMDESAASIISPDGGYHDDSACRAARILSGKCSNSTSGSDHDTSRLRHRINNNVRVMSGNGSSSSCSGYGRVQQRAMRWGSYTLAHPDMARAALTGSQVTPSLLPPRPPRVYGSPLTAAAAAAVTWRGQCKGGRGQHDPSPVSSALTPDGKDAPSRAKKGSCREDVPRGNADDVHDDASSIQDTLKSGAREARMGWMLQAPPAGRSLTTKTGEVQGGAVAPPDDASSEASTTTDVESSTTTTSAPSITASDGINTVASTALIAVSCSTAASAASATMVGSAPTAAPGTVSAFTDIATSSDDPAPAVAVQEAEVIPPIRACRCWKAGLCTNAPCSIDYLCETRIQIRRAGLFRDNPGEPPLDPRFWPPFPSGDSALPGAQRLEWGQVTAAQPPQPTTTAPLGSTFPSYHPRSREQQQWEQQQEKGSRKGPPSSAPSDGIACEGATSSSSTATTLGSTTISTALATSISPTTEGPSQGASQAGINSSCSSGRVTCWSRASEDGEGGPMLPMVPEIWFKAAAMILAEDPHVMWSALGPGGTSPESDPRQQAAERGDAQMEERQEEEEERIAAAFRAEAETDNPATRCKTAYSVDMAPHTSMTSEIGLPGVTRPATCSETTCSPAPPRPGRADPRASPPEAPLTPLLWPTSELALLKGCPGSPLNRASKGFGCAAVKTTSVLEGCVPAAVSTADGESEWGRRPPCLQASSVRSTVTAGSEVASRSTGALSDLAMSSQSYASHEAGPIRGIGGSLVASLPSRPRLVNSALDAGVPLLTETAHSASHAVVVVMVVAGVHEADSSGLSKEALQEAEAAAAEAAAAGSLVTAGAAAHAGQLASPREDRGCNGVAALSPPPTPPTLQQLQQQQARAYIRLANTASDLKRSVDTVSELRDVVADAGADVWWVQYNATFATAAEPTLVAEVACDSGSQLAEEVGVGGDSQDVRDHDVEEEGEEEEEPIRPLSSVLIHPLTWDRKPERPVSPGGITPHKKAHKP